MSLKHILLGMLRTPQSGYDLKKEFDGGIGNFWTAELSQIYPLLKKMESQGLVSGEEQESEQGPTRRCYRTTKSGARELQSWLEHGPQVGHEKLAFLAQTYFLDELADHRKAEEFMEELNTYIKDWLTELQMIDRHWAAEVPGYPESLSDAMFYPNLTLQLGLVKVKAMHQWSEQSLAAIRQRIARDEAASAIEKARSED